MGDARPGPWPANCHPFRYGDYTLAHNGAIHPQSKLGEMLPAEWERQLPGTTDGERYFLHLMWRLERRGGDMAAAIADTQASIGSRYAVNSLNAILLSPDRMYAISWHDPPGSRRPSYADGAWGTLRPRSPVIFTSPTGSPRMR